MYAIISDRNNQATVRVGDVIACDLMENVNPGDPITFEHILLISGDGNTRVGKPTVEGAVVKGEVLGMHKGKKIIVFRFRRRKNIRRKTGHRQRYTKVRITEIA